MLLCADADAASADLASACSPAPPAAPGGCGRGGTGGVGHPGARRDPAAAARRGRCRSCGATHILLPSWAVPRRADAAGVIARAAALSALHGTGTARLGAKLGIPAATVRGWLRCLRAGPRAAARGRVRVGPPRRCHRARHARDPCPAGPTGSPLGDALALVTACAIAAIRWHGQRRRTGRLIGRFGLAAALAPAPGS